MSKEKICTKCGRLFFSSGLLCIPCYQKNYYESNREKIRKKKAIYYENNKERIDEKSREYNILNKEKVKLKNRVHYNNNKSTILAYQKSIRHTPIGRFKQGKQSAKERNLKWTLSFDEYKLLISKVCHYCKQSLEGFCGTSLDRIDNSMGYIASNVLPCCGKCNNIRNNFLTVEEMEVAMEAIVKYRKEHSNET
jgi:hypothetical protein